MAIKRYNTNQTLIDSGFRQRSGDTLTLSGSTIIASAGTMSYATCMHEFYTARSVVDADFVTGRTSCIIDIGQPQQVIFRDVSGITGATGFTYDKATSGVTVPNLSISITPPDDILGEYILTWDDTFKQVRKIPAATSVGLQTAENGLTATGSVVRLGGTLNQCTVIDGANEHQMIFRNLGGACVATTEGNIVIDSRLSTGGVYIKSQSGTGNTAASFVGAVGIEIEYEPNRFVIHDNRSAFNRVGIEYAANYSPRYTNRSLVDKEYVDTIASGLQPKQAVAVATTGETNNIDLSESGITTFIIDGVEFGEGVRVLVKDQNDARENGIYIITGGTWQRTEDFDEDAEVVQGAYTFVVSGQTNESTQWVVTTPDPIAVDVTPINWVLFNRISNIVAGSGINVVNDEGVFKVNLGGELTQNANIQTNEYGFILSGLGLNLGTGFNNDIGNDGVVVYSDGRILVGGSFTEFDGDVVGRIVRLNSNGIIDETFQTGSGFNDIVRTIELQSDGKILVGGSFTQYSGSTVEKVVRLNTDGSIDSTFTVTPFSIGGTVRRIKLQQDNRVLVGVFNHDGQILYRLDVDGSIDNTFDSGTTHNNNISIDVIELQSDNKILIGGSFNGYNGVSSIQNFARLNSDGTVDSDFSTNSAVVGWVFTIKKQEDNKIIVGGGISSYDGITINKNLIRINSNATIDNTFNTTGDAFFTSGLIRVYNVIQQDDNYLVAGNFNQYDGESVNSLVRLNSDGSLDTTFNNGSGSFSGTSRYITITNNNILVTNNSISPRLHLFNDDGYEIYSKIFEGKSSGVELSSNIIILTPPEQTTTEEHSVLVRDDNTGKVKLISNFDVGITGSSNGLSDDGQTVVLGGVLTGDTVFSGGTLNYADDYSSGFTKHSLVDVNYVTGITSVIETDIFNLYDLLNVVEVTNHSDSTYDATITDEFIGVSGGTTVNLPNPPKDGQRIIVADVAGNALTNPITINGNGANIIDNVSASINTNFGGITFIYNASEFWSVAGFVN